METRIHNDLALYGSMTLSVNETEFPANPAIGTLIIKGNCLYAYISIGGYTTWYPFASKTNSYIHSQGIPGLTWTITHNLNTTNTWVQIKDADGNVVHALTDNTSANVITASFTYPTAGTAIVVAPSTIDVPEMKASVISAGDGTVVIDADGIRIAGQNVLTSANITAEISGTIGSLSSLTTTTKSNIVAAINEVNSKVGYSGSTGFTGSAGAAGAAGAAGSTGYTGSAGSAGSAGAAGSTGFTGSAGAGFTGSASAGFTGSIGFSGSRGFTGSQGIGFTGSRGITGTSAWVPVPNAAMTYSEDTSYGTTFVKTGGTEGVYDGQVWSTTGYTTASCSATVYNSAAIFNSPVNYDTLFGLTTRQTLTGISQFDYAFNITGDNNGLYVKILENGNVVELNQIPADWSGRSGNTITIVSINSLQIIYNGVSVNYYLNSTLIRSTARQYNDSFVFHFNSLFKAVGTGNSVTGLTRVSFSPVGGFGFTGSAGGAGSAGATGFTGSIGSAGTTGFTGSAGSAGSAGSTGFTGSAGSIGFTGSIGSAGAVGFTGSTGAGFTGSAGANGFTGSTGDSITSTVNFTTWTNVPYDIGSAVVGKPSANQIVLRFRVVRAFTIESTGHQAFADVAATASTVFTVAKNSSSIGTVTFGAGATTSTVSVASTSFIVGDKLVVTAPASADATLSDIDFSFVAKLN